MPDCKFEHSIYKSKQETVWAFWSDMNNHVKLEPGIDKIELDGQFATGTSGRTITSEYVQEWKLTEVIEGKRFVIIGMTPDGEGSLRFAWDFEDEGSGTCLTHRISASGPQVNEYLDILNEMGGGASKSMFKLAAELNKLAAERE